MAEINKKYVTKSEMPFVKGSNNSAVMNENNVSASGHNSVAYGVDMGSTGQISSTGDGSIAGGVCGEYQETILASGNGSIAIGYTTLEAQITATNNGSCANGCAADGGTITASGYGSHAEGYGGGAAITASGLGSHAEGYGAITAQNKGEHAQGKYNVSNKKTNGTSAENDAGSTIHSVGVGTSSNDRKNAFEIMQNGDVYVKGIGGYDGTNAGASGVSTLVGVIGDVETILATI